jgi:transcriptional regulator with XRE-family HTH domain
VSCQDARSAHPPVVTDLGARVRALRRRRQLTLKGLGRLAGLSYPFLSQVERGLARPSIASLERIAAALEVPVARLWPTPRSSGRVRLVRHDEGARDEYGVRDIRGEPLLREWSGRGRDWLQQDTVQEGELAVYVARGTVEVDLEGTVHELGEGDTLRFDGAIRHRLRRTGGARTRALIVAAL